MDSGCCVGLVGGYGSLLCIGRAYGANEKRRIHRDFVLVIELVPKYRQSRGKPREFNFLHLST